MRKGFFRKTLVYIVALTLLFTIFASTSFNVAAEEPNEDPEYLNYGWIVDYNGTYFETTDSQYLNVTLTSSENVHVRLMSMPRFINYQIERDCSTNSTLITLLGLEANKTYYRYEDISFIEEFITDSTGSYSYTQDITYYHRVDIKEAMSTITILGNAIEDPDDENINWLGGLDYELTGDVVDNCIVIKGSGVNLNGNGNKLIINNPILKNTMVGVTISYRYVANDVQDVTISNLGISGFSYGIHSYSSYYNKAINCYIHDNSVGLGTDGHSFYFEVSQCNIYDNTWGMEIKNSNYCKILNSNIYDNWGGGIYGYRSHRMTIKNCWISNNDYGPTAQAGFGVYFNWCGVNNISGNTIINHNEWGIPAIWLTGPADTHGSNATIYDNYIENNYYGLLLGYAYGTGHRNTITYNTIQNNHVGIWCRQSRNIFHHNNIKYNTYQYQEYPYFPPTNIWDDGNEEGNYWSDYEGTYTGVGKDFIGGTLLNHPHTDPPADPANGYAELDAFPFLYPINLIQIAGFWSPTYIGRGVVLKFFEVTQEGKVNLNILEGTPPPNSQLVPENTFYNITTTALYSGAINISIPYDESDVPTQEEDLTLQYYDEITEEWVEITTLVDTTNNKIYGEAFHLSIFAIIIKLNDPPVANAGGPYEGNEGAEIILDASGSYDPNSDPLTYEWDLDNDGEYDDATGITTPFIQQDNGIFTIGLRVTDDELESDTDSVAVIVNNVAPIADAGEDKIGVEPSLFTFTGSHTDPGTQDTHIYEWDFDYDGVTFDIDATGNGASNTWYDDFDGTVALRVTDDDDGWHIDTCTVTVSNAAPTIETLSLTLEPVQLGTPVDLTATFTDPGIFDTHTATIDWGDENTTIGTISGSGGTYTVTDSWTYGQPGVYTITLTVEDDDCGSGTMTFKYIVIYDPSAGFVTGGGWIMSPEGAYTPDPSLTGKANFGFVAKYKKGQSTPDGNTEFQFKVANLNFHSNDYEWLVIQIAGARATYRGTGTINGEGNYGFKITAIDEELTPSTDVDLFRIKIWDKDNNDVIIYDNQLGDDDDSDLTTQISGGNIRIHEG